MQVGSINEESQVRGCYNIYLHHPGNSICIGKDRSKQNIQHMTARVKSKQKQLTNKYKNNYVVYWQASVIHDSNKMINNQQHKMCARLAIKTTISQCRGEYQRHFVSQGHKTFTQSKKRNKERTVKRSWARKTHNALGYITQKAQA